MTAAAGVGAADLLADGQPGADDAPRAPPATLDGEDEQGRTPTPTQASPQPQPSNLTAALTLTPPTSLAKLAPLSSATPSPAPPALPSAAPEPLDLAGCDSGASLVFAPPASASHAASSSAEPSGASRTRSSTAASSAPQSAASVIGTPHPPPRTQAQQQSAQAQHAEPGRLGELKRFTLWETKTRFYLVAFNTSQTRFRILKVDRTLAQPRSRPDASASAEGSGKEAGHAAETSSAADSVTAVASSSDSTQWELNLTSDRVVYTRQQVSELLDMIAEGNRSTGGLKEVGRFFGIVGFIRFTSGYYMVLISARSVVALIGGHYVYHCDDTRIIPVCHPSVLASVPGRSKAKDAEEARLLHTFKQVDLSKNFYFSYTYDLTKTLQDNLTGGSETACPSFAQQRHSVPSRSSTAWGYNEKFVWNHHLLVPAFGASEHLQRPRHEPDASLRNAESAADASVDAASEWVLPLVYGFVDQAKLSVLNRTVHITLLARRSRHFAGARFLKRGTDEEGHVANDVETEQIVSDGLTTPFYAPTRSNKHHNDAHGSSNGGADAGLALGVSPRYTSYVMHRGSIPIYWTQDSTNMSPRPPIEISVVDPYFSSAALHFDDMLRRYGHPVIVLNLIKSKEKQPREVKLLHAFGECVAYLNQFLPADKRLRYIAWDMSRASKSHDQDVIGVLEDIAEGTVEATRFFHSGPEPALFESAATRNVKSAGPRRETILLQSGVARVNCVDCLDRTNAAQFVIGKAALGHQLHALGLLESPSLPFDSAAVDMLTEMYHDLGDTIALQYGGSHLVNTMETYRKVNQWTSHSRDMLEGLKRYYSNSFVDADKQAAINLFLGIDPDTAEARPAPRMLDAHGKFAPQRRSYRNWFTPEYLEDRGTVQEREQRLKDVVTADRGFWAEYYRPSLFTDLLRHHAFKMTAVHQHQQAVIGPPSTAAYVSASRFAQSPSTSSHARKTSNGSSIIARSVSIPSISEDNALPVERAVVTLSPFTARVPGGSAPTPASPVRAKPSGSESPRALIGGVRRWMSLNRDGKRDGQSKRRSSARTAGGPVSPDSEKEPSSGAAGGTASVEITPSMQRDAWPNWGDPERLSQHPVVPSAVQLVRQVHALTVPTVSALEAREYDNWLSQFGEKAECGMRGLGARVADEDAALYASGADLAAGEALAVARMMAQYNLAGVAEEEGGWPSAHPPVDAALQSYAHTAQMLRAGAPSMPTSEGKLRAYNSWLTGPVDA